ncbi:hypothetical protein [Thermanaeromonas sp.]|uniref:hypothetical protein n=1 Tax=Thermanaeromonas sp. TaxID=2003697 RepID=UPI00262C431B|nr:hypothetical protein [Thermanaeromonas sp.]
MALSLCYDHYTDDELKVFLTALGWAVFPDTQESFYLLLLRKTLDDLRKAREEINELRDREGLEQEEFLSRYGRDYRTLSGVPGANLLGDKKDLKPAIEALRDGRLAVNVPFYCVISGVYHYFDWLCDFLVRFSTGEKGKKEIQLDSVTGNLKRR